jgi:hypothetical protein
LTILDIIILMLNHDLFDIGLFIISSK